MDNNDDMHNEVIMNYRYDNTLQILPKERSKRYSIFDEIIVYSSKNRILLNICCKQFCKNI